MKTCSTCKHYEENPDLVFRILRGSNSASLDDDKALPVSHVVKRGQCNSGKMYPAVQWDSHEANSAAYPTASDEHDMRLNVGPDFGCIHHETK